MGVQRSEVDAFDIRSSGHHITSKEVAQNLSREEDFHARGIGLKVLSLVQWGHLTHEIRWSRVDHEATNTISS